MEKYVIVIALLLIGINKGQTSLLNQKLQTVFTSYSTCGMSVVVLKNDSMVYSGHYGIRDVGRSLPVNSRTMYRIASISKMITATTLMTLYDEGKFNLDADISNYLGYTLRNPYFPNDVITIRKILSHTASLRDGTGYDNFLSATSSQNPPPDLKTLLISGGAYYTSNMWSSSKGPGSNYFTYANIDYGIIGTLIEKFSGQRFDIAARNRVLQPLGITGSFNVQDLDSINNVAVLYRKSGGSWAAQADNYGGVKPTPRNLSAYVIGSNGIIFSPTGGLRISAEDLSKFMLMHMNGGVYRGARVISDSSCSLIQMPAWTYNGSNGDNYYGIFNTYGFGCHRTTELLPGETLFGHPGEAYGLISDMYFSKAKDYGIVFITNGAIWGDGSYSGWYNMEEDVYKSAQAALPGFLTALNKSEPLSRSFRLTQNYPNPFNPETVISYELPETGLVSLKIFDISGKEVAELVNAQQPKGSYSLIWNADNLSSGIYICSLEFGGTLYNRKMILVK